METTLFGGKRRMRHALNVHAGVIHGAMGVLLASAIFLFRVASGWSLILGVIILILLAYLLYAPSNGFPPAIILADETDFPMLNGLVARIARTIGVAPPPVMLVTEGCCALGLIGWQQKPLLILDQQMLMRAEPDEIVVLIAHELGHLRDGSCSRTAVHLAAWIVLMRLARLTKWAWIRRIHHNLQNLRHEDAQLAEFTADRWSVFVAGRVATARTLQKFAATCAPSHPTVTQRLTAIMRLPYCGERVLLSSEQRKRLYCECCLWYVVMRRRQHQVQSEQLALC